MGVGEGTGDGKGKDTGMNVAAGSGVAIALTVCFFCVGIPVIFVGAIFLAVTESGSGLWTGGLVMIILSVLFLVGGIVMVILICTGVFTKNKVQDGPVTYGGGNTVVMSHTGYNSNVQQPPPYTQGVPPPYNPPGQAEYNQPGQSQALYNQPGQGQATAPDPAYPPGHNKEQQGGAAPY